MDCPKCGFARPGEEPACPACGLIFARYAERAAVVAAGWAVPAPPPDVTGVTAVPDLDPAGRRAVFVGVPAGIVLAAVPLLNVFVGYLSVLVHELGHTVAAWAFGYPAIPAFDFVYGGGVTIHEERNAGLLIVIAGLFATTAWIFRRNRTTLGVLGALAAAYVALAATGGHEIVHLAAGHAAELVFAGIFLFRALDGSACKLEVERPLYAALGTFLLLKAAHFAFRLRTSAEFRIEYEEAKGGGAWMDFSRLASEYLHTSVETLAGLFLLAALVTPLAVWGIYRVRGRLAPLADQLLAR